MMRRYWHFGLLLSALVAGCSRPPADSPQEEVKVVATAPLRLPVVEWDECLGRIDPIEEVEVRALANLLRRGWFTGPGSIQSGGRPAGLPKYTGAADVHA
jgi:hypothetical protein